MRRGGDGDEFVTISPPPEFQDPVTLPPPPIFRDGAQGEDIQITTSSIQSQGSSGELSTTQSGSGQPTEKIRQKVPVLKTVTLWQFVRPMTPPVLARVAQLHGSSEAADCDTISTTTSWEYVSKSSSLSDLTRFGTTFLSSQNSEEIVQHPSSAHQQQYGRTRSLLPHGIVPLPPPHRTSHYNGQNYRTSQKDLVQSEDAPAVPSRMPCTSRAATSRNDPNSVMRSASFNLGYAAVKKPNYKLQSTYTPELLPLPNRRSKPEIQKPVVVNEAADGSSSEVYNVPYQGEIYSLPVDSITPANTAAAPPNNRVSQLNQNQRLKKEIGSSTNVPPVQKSNLCRRKSHEGDRSNSSFNTHSSQSQNSKQLDERKGFRPPQRWSSLSVQPQPTTNISKEASPSQSAFVNVPGSSKQAVVVVESSKLQSNSQHITLSNHPENVNAVTRNGSTSEANSSNNTKSRNVNGLNTSECGNTGNTVAISSKKPRSRSVDPAGTVDQQRPNQNSLKPTTSSTLSNACVNDSQGNPNSTDYGGSAEHHHSGSFVGKESTDRKNPLGLSFLNLFRRNKGGNSNGKQNHNLKTENHDDFSEIPAGSFSSSNNNSAGINNNNKDDASYYFRELPPPPPGHSEDSSDEPSSPSPMECRDFAASIERVKDCGWYWGPLSSEAAEDLLRNEPDGSFIVRDSSDARYIFSLTFKLHGLVRHVRIEHDQGNFSFGPLTRFKAATIVDFVEKAVAHSRSGRYLFFLHRRPVLGPMQVQLLHPYSRFMHPRSLKHMCRFVILKYVRRDLIHTLPLPKPLQEYLNTPHYYFEPPESNSKNNSNHHGITQK